MSKLIMVDGHDGLARTPSGGIVNINKEEINIAKEAKRKRLAKEEEFETLKQDVEDIKTLLHKLVEKL